MSRDEITAVVQRFATEAWSTGNVAIFDEVCAPNYGIGDGGTLQTLKDVVLSTRKSFPDLHCTVEEIIAEGDTVAYRWTMRGTHQAEYDGIPATGKPVKATGITILHFADGKIVHDQFESSGPSIVEQIS